MENRDSFWNNTKYITQINPLHLFLHIGIILDDALENSSCIKCCISALLSDDTDFYLSAGVFPLARLAILTHVGPEALPYTAGRAAGAPRTPRGRRWWWTQWIWEWS